MVPSGKHDRPPAIALVMAGQRQGVVNPLAEHFGVSHKCLIPIGGEPLITHVLGTLTGSEGIGSIRIAIEASAREALAPVQARYADSGVAIETLPSKQNLVDSVIHAAGDDPGPFLVTTADNALLTAATVEKMLSSLARSDAAAVLTTREAVHAVNVRGQRRFYQLRDDAYANCNIYGLANRRAFAALDVFREGGQFMRNPARMARAFGLFTILLMRAGWLTRKSAARRIGRRFGIDFEAIVTDDGTQAIDVDNPRTYNIVASILAARQGKEAPTPIPEPAGPPPAR
jgi:GTP:adenosylcobinamide-phosphate guanylyltransferase